MPTYLSLTVDNLQRWNKIMSSSDDTQSDVVSSSDDTQSDVVSSFDDTQSNVATASFKGDDVKEGLHQRSASVAMENWIHDAYLEPMSLEIAGKKV